MDSTTFNIMLAVEILMFVVVGGGSTFWGPLLGAVVAERYCRNSCARCANGWNCCPVAWTNFYPAEPRSTTSCTASSISRTPSG